MNLPPPPSDTATRLLVPVQEAIEQLSDGGAAVTVATASPLDRLLAALPDARRDGLSFKARCPSHEDRIASLGIREAQDGRVLLRCRAGCQTEAVVAALGLEMADLFVSRPATAAPKPARTQEVRHPVRDLDGTVVAVHCRVVGVATGKKVGAVWWEQPDGVRGLNGTRVEELPLFVPEKAARLAELEDGTAVILTEGEPAAVGLAWCGLAAAATVTGAATIPCDDVLHGLVRFRVQLWPDNDDPGREHMRRIAARLVALGCPSVELIEPPADAPRGWDAADCLRPFAGRKDRLGGCAAVAALPRHPWSAPEDVHAQEKVYTRGPCASSGSDVHLRLVAASSVKPERVSWGWQYRVPVGMVTILVGQGGVGKSLELVTLAAGWSRGTIPGDFYGEPVPVAIATAEDHRAAVVLPRLVAAGADLSLVSFPEIVSADGVPGDIAIDGRFEELERGLSEAGVRALLIDTVIAHMPGGHDSYKEQDVRAALKPLAHMAERCGIAVVGVMHLNRREARDVLTRISGSGAFGNLARSVLVFATDPDDPDSSTRILAVGKSNVGARPSALRLRIEECLVPTDDGLEIPTARVVVMGDTTHTISDLLGAPSDDGERTALAEAVDFLHDLLADGKMPALRVQEEARAAGVSGMLRRAQKRLGIRPRKDGMTGGWVWELPTDGADEHLRATDETADEPEDAEVLV